jgi:hypothetical protein
MPRADIAFDSRVFRSLRDRDAAGMVHQPRDQSARDLHGRCGGPHEKGPSFKELAVGVALLVASRELEFFAVQPVPLALGLLMQAAGAILCLRSVSGFD